MTDDAYLRVARADEIAEKQFGCFKIGDHPVVICRFRGEFFALENRCSHANSTFDEGRLRAFNLICPLHGGTFDIRDGSATGLPARRPIGTWPVRVRDGWVEVKF